MIDLEAVIFSFIGIFVVGLFGLGGWLIYDGVVSDKFYLAKDEWSCASSHIENGVRPQAMVGANGQSTTILIPYNETVCDRYERKVKS